MPQKKKKRNAGIQALERGKKKEKSHCPLPKVQGKVNKNPFAEKSLPGKTAPAAGEPGSGEEGAVFWEKKKAHSPEAQVRRPKKGEGIFRRLYEEPSPKEKGGGKRKNKKKKKKKKKNKEHPQQRKEPAPLKKKGGLDGKSGRFV